MSREGVWTAPNGERVRVYYDGYGPMSSGYILVHWEDAHKVPGCLSNGYMAKGGPTHDTVDWNAASPAEEERIRREQKQEDEALMRLAKAHAVERFIDKLLSPEAQRAAGIAGSFHRTADAARLQRAFKAAVQTAKKL